MDQDITTSYYYRVLILVRKGDFRFQTRTDPMPVPPPYPDVYIREAQTTGKQVLASVGGQDEHTVPMLDHVQ